MERIKYYSNTDMSTGYNLRNSEKVMNDFDEEKKYYINDVLEFYNIVLLINVNDLHLTSWTETEIKKYQNICDKMERYIAKEAKKITDSNFNLLFNEADFVYRDDFFVIINKYRIYEELSFKAFSFFIFCLPLYFYYRDR